MNNSSEYIILDKLGDTIERLEFSQNKSNPYLLSAGGWDGKFYLWSISLNQSSTNLTMLKPNTDNTPEYDIASTQQIISFNLEEPIFSLCWKLNTNLVLAGTVEGSLFHLDLESSRFNKIHQFDTGVREILHFQDDSFDLIITGNYDGIIRLWDIRDFSSPKKLRVGVFQPEIVFEANFNNLLPIYSIGCLPNMEGFCSTCLEGKVSLAFMDVNAQPKLLSKDSKKLAGNDQNFIFRAHRKNDNDSYMINQVKVNKAYGTFATCGGDGNVIIWDHLSKSRLKMLNFPGNPPITAINFSLDGNIISYACGEDWSEGHSFTKKIETKVGLKYLSNSEKMKKQPERK